MLNLFKSFIRCEIDYPKSAAPPSDISIKISEAIIPPLNDEYNEATATVPPIGAAPACNKTNNDDAPADDDPNIAAPPGGAPGAPLKT